MQGSELHRRLTGEVVGSLRVDMGTRELYSCDASLYRRRPRGVLRAGRADDLEAAVKVCGDLGMPLTMRGAGTSLAGQTVGTGLVVDCSALDEIEIDPGRRVARVGPGVVLDHLNARAAASGLIFGPDVATASRATLGGMISNNSAGARSVVHGLTADHVLSLDVVLADGTRATLRRGDAAPAALAACAALADSVEVPTLLRRVSGYALDALRGDAPDWPRLICGSEGTLAVITRAELRLVELPACRGLVVVGFDDVNAALAAVVPLLATHPSAIELLDGAMVDPANRPRATAGLVGVFSGSPAMLVVEFSGSAEQVACALRDLPKVGETFRDVITDDAQQAAVWAVRRAGIARALRGGDEIGRDAKPIAIIEDPAVAPEHLVSFAGEVRRLLVDEGVPAVWYGHASVGCLHIRPLMDLRADGAIARLRRLAESVADLVAAHDGSLSGEHGDGRSRGELLPRMFTPRTMDAFRDVKRHLDPNGLLNPGVLIDADPLDSGLRIVASPPRRRWPTSVAFDSEGGLARAAEACNGNGACRSAAGTMCPSFQALGDERHSTRGRAVLLRAALEGRLPDGLADDALHEAMELCLGCKACLSECPASVDMARMKVEALAHRAARHGLSLTQRAAGRAHEALALGSRAPALAGIGAAIGSRVVGRTLPRPRQAWQPAPATGSGPTVVLMADTFTRFLHPEIGTAAQAVLTACGARVEVVTPGCCGRPLLSAGMVDAARRRARGALDRLAPSAIAGTPIVVLEPSCESMFTDDLAKLLPSDPRVGWVAAATVSFSRAVLDLGGPALRAAEAPIDVAVHEHCHARALGTAGPAAALVGMVEGATAHDSGAGCCGMAGAFGFLHPELSRQIGEDRLLPAARRHGRVVATGTSCRQQVAELAGVPVEHPAEFLARHLL